MFESLQREYTVGEKRLVEWSIQPNSKIDTVVVTDARYELLKNGDIIKKGHAEVNGLKISVMFEAEEKGNFILRIFVTVPPETIKSELSIYVIS